MIEAVQTDAAPQAIGPYSQAVVHGGMVYCSGQVALVPATGALLAGGVTEQTEQVMRNLAAVLTAAGSSTDRIVKTTIYLVSMADFAAVNACYERFLGPVKPARATVAVAELPKGARVEIDCIATVGA